MICDASESTYEGTSVDGEGGGEDELHRSSRARPCIARCIEHRADGVNIHLP